MADGTGTASKVVGGDFQFVEQPVQDEISSDLLTVQGVKGEMVYKVKFGTSASADATEMKNRVKEVAERVLDTAIEHFSTFHKSSEVNEINAMLFGDVLTVSKEMAEVLEVTDVLFRRTRGAFDAGLAPLLEHYATAARVLSRHEEGKRQLSKEDSRKSVVGGLVGKLMKGVKHLTDDQKKESRIIGVWETLLKRGFAPSEQRLSQVAEEIKQFSSWSQFHFDKQDRKLRKLHANAMLDLHGVAKGWALEQIAKELFEDVGIDNLFVEWAGDVKVRGNNPNGRPWTLAIPEPPSVESLLNRAKAKGLSIVSGDLSKGISSLRKGSDEEPKYIAVLDLKDGMACCTSGDYEQVKVIRDRLYSHVLNASSGKLTEIGDEQLAQVVVVAQSAILADGLATAALGIGDPAKARSLLDPFRTSSPTPLSDFILYAREGPRVVRLTVPGVETIALRKQRLTNHKKGAKVLIVGSGLAGLTAAVSAAQVGASVIVLEKEARVGGNSAKATSGINGWGTVTQAKNQVSDSEAKFERDTFLSGDGGHTNHSLVRILSSQSASAIHFLMEEFGLPLTVLSQLGGHSSKRTHRAPPDEQGRPRPIGFTIIQHIKKYIEREMSDKIEIRLNTAVESLISHTEEDEVKVVEGVVAVNGETGKSEKLMADSVILATGGFGCDRRSGGLMEKYRPDLMCVPTTNGAFAVGEGMEMGMDIGASYVDMDKVQLHPTGFVDPKDPENPTKFLAPEMVRGSGGILLNQSGHRFINELDLRSVVSKGIFDNCEPYDLGNKKKGPRFAWILLSEEAQKILGLPTLGFYKDTLGLFDAANDYKEAADIIGCDPGVLKKTLASYDKAMKLGLCEKTGKNVFPAPLTDKSRNLVIARVTPSVHYTMGGLEINGACEVQEELKGSVFGKHRSIQRLFAAGEVSGGVHGANRLGGNSLLECVVFGRIAGERAATVKQKSTVCLLEDEWVPCTLREMRNTDLIYGQNTRVFRFNLHGSTQHSGLKTGQFLAVKGQLDGNLITGFFSPITRVDDLGVVGILCRTDSKGGPIVNLLNYIRPGSTLHIKAMGGIKLDFTKKGITHNGRRLERIGLLCAGTGLAPGIQIARAYFGAKGIHIERARNPSVIDLSSRKSKSSLPINLLYAAEEGTDLAFLSILETMQKKHSEDFRFYPILNRPPLGWRHGIGFVTAADIKEHIFYPPADGQLFVICGPAIVT